MPAEPPTGRTLLPIIAGDWKEAPAIKARLAGGFCIRAQVQGPCAYANICEHCPNLRTDAGHLPVLAAQRADAETLARVSVPLPVPAAGQVVRELAYTHFTVLLDPTRRLAVATGVNIAGAELRDVERSDDWRLDPRVGAGEQAGADLYAGNDLDRGHLVRRSDPVWGEPAVAAQANVDTFVYPNAAPQAADFNQSKQLWLGLEDYVLTYADTYDTRLSVFTAPVLAADDPQYRGVGVPRLFWKVAVWIAASDVTGEDRLLASTGYVLDQTPQLDDIDLSTRRALLAGDPPLLGPYRTYQVPIADIATLTGLDLGPLVAADRFPVLAPVGARSRERWVRLDTPAAIQL